MTGIKAGGVGSGLDINGLVAQLVAADRAPQAQRLNRVEAKANFQLSALARLTSAFDALKRATDPLKADTSYQARRVTSSAEDAFTATAGANTPNGSFQIEVLALAAASKQVSAGLAEGSALGGGALQVQLGEASFEVAIDPDATPEQARDAFNAAAQAAGAGVAATMVRGDNGEVSLAFTAQQTGLANALSITSADPGLAALTSGQMTALSTAADAQVRIDGVLRSSATNVIEGAVDGLSITAKAITDTPQSLTVARDNAPARQAAQGLVNAFNGAMSALREATRFNAATGEAGALNGDALARGAGAALRNSFIAFVGEASDLGISGRVDGNLSFDAAKFDAALAADPDRVESLLKGFGAAMAETTGRYVGDAGAFTDRRKGLDSQVRRVADQREALDRRMEQVEGRYLRQFTALDSLIGQLNNTSAFLSQQLDGLAGLNRQIANRR